jgi:adenylate cyclase
MARRLAAILFSDIDGFTALTQRDEKAALELLQEQEGLVLPLLETHQGRRVKSTGDGLLLEFSNALDAIEYAVDLQRRLHERSARPGSGPPRLRMAIHLGDVQDVGTDLFGDAVNLAAHILPIAEPGGVCMSDPVYAQVRNRVAYQIEKLGSRPLKGVIEPMDLYRVVLPWDHEQVPTRSLMSRRLAAIMITDVVGFTASAQANEADALARLREQEEILRPLFGPFKGREIKSTGDGFLVEFESALGALECAVEIQRRMRERNSNRRRPPLELRIGIHAGDVEESGGDIFGDAVNIASRVEPLAEPGGVCLSEPVYVQVRSKVPYYLENIGAKTLKGVREPMEVYRVVLSEATEGTIAGSLPFPRIAVLPLTNMSPDPADEYFADGLTEEMISTLSKVRDLSVISRTSVMQYKGHPKRMAEIGRELNVGTILEGSVRRAGNRVRIAVQLVDPVADKHLWAENYDRNLADIFSIQSEIAQKVASVLEVRLRGEDEERVGKIPTEVTEAHLLYMKGQFHLQHLSKEELRTALWYFEQAIQQDPRYALAHAAVAQTYGWLAWFEMMPSSEAVSKQEAEAKKALELDPTLAEAHWALAGALHYSWDFKGILREGRRALELNPSSSEARLGVANWYNFVRKFEEARTEAQKALSLDPLSSRTIRGVADIYLYGGRPEKAAELYERVLAMDPTNSFALDNLGLCCVRQGRYDEGIAKIRKANELEQSTNPLSLADLVYALSKGGQTEEARRTVSELVTYHREHGVGAAAVATSFASVGDREAAFDWLERAYQEHSLNLVGISVDFGFETLQEDPRFQKWLKKIGIPERVEGN